MTLHEDARPGALSLEGAPGRRAGASAAGGRHRRLLIWSEGALAEVWPCVYEATAAALAAHRLRPVPESVMALNAGLSPERALANLAHAPRHRPNMRRLVDDYRAAYHRAAAGLRLLDGIERLLENLNAGGVTSALVTNSHLAEAQHIEDHLGLGRWIDLVLTADDVALEDQKPSAAMADAALRALGVSRGDALVIGDTLPDVEMGMASGILTVAATWGPHAEIDLGQAQPAWLAGDVDALAGVVDAWLDGRATPARSG